MNKNGLTEFDIERPEFKMRIKKGAGSEYSVGSTGGQYIFPTPATMASSPSMAHVPPQAASAPAPAADDGSILIKAPMVGTFYSASSPDAQPFVQVGSEIKEDTVVCIIEAMKMMNEIKAEVRGTVIAIEKENGKPVEFGSVLFRIKPA